MKENEIDLIKEISDANNINPNMLIKLIEIEKMHANLNMSRRSTIFNELNLTLDSYINEGDV